MEATQMSVNWWLDKPCVVYPCNGMLFSSKKKWSTGICYNKSDPLKHYTKWKKPVTKEHMLHDAIYTMYPE